MSAATRFLRRRCVRKYIEKPASGNSMKTNIFKANCVRPACKRDSAKASVPPSIFKGINGFVGEPHDPNGDHAYIQPPKLFNRYGSIQKCKPNWSGPATKCLSGENSALQVNTENARRHRGARCLLNIDRSRWGLPERSS